MSLRKLLNELGKPYKNSFYQPKYFYVKNLLGIALNLENWSQYYTFGVVYSDLKI